MALKSKKTTKKTEKKASFMPFEKENVVKPLKLFISIVPSGQGDAIKKIMEQNGASFNFVTNGEGTGKNYLTGLLAGTDIKKNIVFTFIREDKAKQVCESLEERFSASRVSNGVSFSIKLSSIAGVSVYRFLTNTRKVKRVQSNDEY